ncbi:MAG: amidohydrolase, partial [Hyphomicrobiales bacterium]|nr:amidohydrolase [Hyphomicrobiales bacterium]
VETRVVSAVSNLLGNAPLEKLMHDNFMRLGPPDFDERDREVAAKFHATLTKEDILAAHRRHGLKVEPDKVLCDTVVPLNAEGAGGVGSTDVGDVSWVVPTVQARGATCAIGTPFHSWQLTGQGKTSFAHKGLVHVAKVMAGTAIDAIRDADVIAQAKADLQERTQGTPYASPLPPEVKPALDMSVAA